MKPVCMVRKAACALAMALGVGAAAQAACPDKPIKLVLAFAPASSTDIVARLLAELVGPAKADLDKFN